MSAGEDVRQKRQRFRQLHDSGTFVIPNPWDAGSARILQHLGFQALATTSSGFAATLGRDDQQVTRDELIAHVALLTASVRLPISVDAEHGYSASSAGVAETVEMLAAAGVAGLSIEDYDPVALRVVPIDAAAERISIAAQACARHDLVLTARAENHLYGNADLDDTIARLRAYRQGGADVVYAPGLTDVAEIARVVGETGAPVNVLALPDGPSVRDLAAAGVRRVSTGGALAWAAYGGLVDAARELLLAGTSSYLQRAVSAEIRNAAFEG